MCRAIPVASGRMVEPLEPRRLLSAAPAPIDPMELPGAVRQPDGTILVPASPADPRADAPADDTTGFFSTTPRTKPDPTVSWDAQPHASPSGTSAPQTASTSYTTPFATVTGYCAGAELNNRDGYFKFGLTDSCGPGANDAFAPAGGVTINYSLPPADVRPATPGSDYGGPLLARQVLIPQGYALAFVPFTPVRDRVIEGHETVKVALESGAGYSVSGNGGKGGNGGPASDPLVDTPYRVGVESKTFTVGFTEKLALTVRDAEGFPPQAATLNIKANSYNPAVIQPQQPSVATDANGNAALPVKGIGAGLAALLLEVAQNPKVIGQGNQQAAHATIDVTALDGFSGQGVVVHVTVTGADNKPLQGAQVQSAPNGPADAEHIFAGDPDKKTDEQGKVDLIVILKKSTPAGTPATLKLTLKEDPGGATKLLPVTVHKIYLAVTPRLTLSAKANTPNNKGQIDAVVTEIPGNAKPVQGVTLTPLDIGAGNVEIDIPSSSLTSDVMGRVVIKVFGNPLKDGINSETTKVRVKASLADDEDFKDVDVTVTN